MSHRLPSNLNLIQNLLLEVNQAIISSLPTIHHPFAVSSLRVCLRGPCTASLAQKTFVASVSRLLSLAISIRNLLPVNFFLPRQPGKGVFSVRAHPRSLARTQQHHHHHPMGIFHPFVVVVLRPRYAPLIPVLDTCVVPLAGLAVNEDRRRGQEVRLWLRIELALIPVLMPVHGHLSMISHLMTIRSDLVFSVPDSPNRKQHFTLGMCRVHIRPVVWAAVSIIRPDNPLHQRHNLR